MKRILIIITLSLAFTSLSLTPPDSIHGPLLSSRLPIANSPFSILNPQLPINALAAENQDSLSITVVIPPAEKPDSAPPIEPEPEVKPQINYLYPISVVETQEQGKKMIIKTYELGPEEKPESISRESFTRSNRLYELADITKVENVSLNQREHTETVTVNSSSREMEAILKLLPPEKDFQSEDGCSGSLSLDISSIQIETAGTRANSYTVTATREYPHLSSNDASLVPKSINDNGRTLNLSNIQWKAQNTSAIDYNAVPSGYTAVATYSGSASRTTVTGYNITAAYSGAIAKITTDKTIYTAYFIGVPIIKPLLGQLTALSEVEEVVLTEEEPVVNENEVVSIDSQKPNAEPYIPWPMLLVMLALGIKGGILFYCLKNSYRKEKTINEETTNTT